MGASLVLFVPTSSDAPIPTFAIHIHVQLSGRYIHVAALGRFINTLSVVEKAPSLAPGDRGKELETLHFSLLT